MADARNVVVVEQSSRGRAVSAQEELRRELLDGFEQLNRRLAEVGETVPPQLLGAHPAGGGWSIGQILEHICLAGLSYLPAIDRLLAQPGKAPYQSGGWRPTIAGRLLRYSLESSRRLPAPVPLRPGATPRPEVLTVALELHADICQRIGRAERSEWRKLTLSSPFAWFIRMNLGDAFLVLLRHGERHTAQIERVATEIRRR